MAAEAEAALQGALIVLVVGATLPLHIARTVMSMQITTVITITATSEFTLTPIIITIVMRTMVQVLLNRLVSSRTPNVWLIWPKDNEIQIFSLVSSLEFLVYLCYRL